MHITGFHTKKKKNAEQAVGIQRLTSRQIVKLIRKQFEGKIIKKEETYILNAVCMCLVLHDGVGRQVKDSAQCVSDASCRRLVACRFIPDRNDVLLNKRNTQV